MGGRKSRDKGKRGEREFRAVMADLTGWPNWRRTQDGNPQEWGDLVPVTSNGEKTLGPTAFYVECKRQRQIRLSAVRKWWDEVVERSDELQDKLSEHVAVGVLIVRPDYGFPVCFVEAHARHLLTHRAPTKLRYEIERLKGGEENGDAFDELNFLSAVIVYV